MTSMCIAAADYLIERTNEYNSEKQLYRDKILMTCKRLQKLLYFSEVYFMKLNKGKFMFTDDFYAWASGPVIPSVYRKYVHFQTGEMMPSGEENHTPLTEEMRRVLDIVFEETICKETSELVDASHVKYGPWWQVYDESDMEHQQVISKEYMFDFYENREVFPEVVDI